MTHLKPLCKSVLLEEEDNDLSQCAEDLVMGDHFFLDSKSVSCREETIDDEEQSQKTAMMSSQVSTSNNKKCIQYN